MTDIKLYVIALSLAVLGLLFVKYKKQAIAPFTVALLLATIWSFTFRYEYTGGNIFLLNTINIYPLILWTVGLTSLQLLSYALPTRNRFILTSLAYFVLLFAIEAIGYHILNIRLQSQYPSLFGLGVIHAPTMVKVFYISAGPVYLLFLKWINLRFLR